MRRDFGPPHYSLMLPPIVKRNYGKWKYHEILEPGVLKHVSESEEELYTVRVGMPKFVSVTTIRMLCDLADKYCDGYFRFTSRNNAEFLVPKKENVNALIKEITRMGFPVGGTGNGMTSIIQCTGWMHCHTAATDSAGIAKALYDELFDSFQRMDLPAYLRIAVSGCLNMCGAVHCSDIAILGVHRTPPKVIDDVVARACEVPSLIAACPTYAIKPKPPKSIQIDPERCMYCGICYVICPGTPIADPKNDGVSIWVGGKISNARSPPKFSRLAVPYLPNNPPRWPEVTNMVKKIVETWIKHAKKDERIGEWIERVGWGRFFKLTEIPFTDKHIDDYVFSIPLMRKSTLFKF